MPRRRYLIDDRTKTMSVAALTCRTFGHSLVWIPTPGPLRAQHRRDGERLIQLRCSRCTYCRDRVVDFYSGGFVRAKSWYSDGGKDYLVQEPGTGRLGKDAATAAFFAQDDKSP